MTFRGFACPALALALFGCSPPAEETGSPEAENTAAPTVEARGSPGSADGAINLAMQELTPAEMEQSALTGELACSFAPSPGGETLFIGRADVLDAAGAQGAIKLPDGVRVLAMEGTGGFGAMSRGARFVGDDVRVAIALTADQSLPEHPPISGESPALPAMMTLTGGTSALSIQGVFECGP